MLATQHYHSIFIIVYYVYECSPVFKCLISFFTDQLNFVMAYMRPACTFARKFHTMMIINYLILSYITA